METTAAAAAAPGGGGDSDSEGSAWDSEEDDFTSSSQQISPHAPAAGAMAAARGPAAAGAAGAAGSAPVAVPGRAGTARAPSGLYPLSENSKEGRASTPSQGPLGFPSGYDTSRGGEPSAATTTSSAALPAANGRSPPRRPLTSAHGSDPRLAAPSEASSGAPWQSAYGESSAPTSTATTESEDESESGTSSEEEEESSSSEEDEEETTEGLRGPASASASANSAFTFDRSSRPSGTGTGSGAAGAGPAAGRGSSSALHRSRRSKGESPRLRQLLYIQMEFCPRWALGAGRFLCGAGPGAGPWRWVRAFGWLVRVAQPGQRNSASGEQRRQQGKAPAKTHSWRSKLQALPTPTNPLARRTLRDVLDAGPLEEADRWRILRQILAGLAHIHSQVRADTGGRAAAGSRAGQASLSGRASRWSGGAKAVVSRATGALRAA